MCVVNVPDTFIASLCPCLRHVPATHLDPASRPRPRPPPKKTLAQAGDEALACDLCRCAPCVCGKMAKSYKHPYEVRTGYQPPAARVTCHLLRLAIYDFRWTCAKPRLADIVSEAGQQPASGCLAAAWWWWRSRVLL